MADTVSPRPASLGFKQKAIYATTNLRATAPTQPPQSRSAKYPLPSPFKLVSPTERPVNSQKTSFNINDF
jgi:hypothetical protein